MSASADYETDFYLWTQQQAALLRQGLLSAVDIENLAEEVESMGSSQKNALQSYLFNIVMHLLKWRYQPERRGSSWVYSIRNGRNAIERLLENNPSLKPQLPALIMIEHRRARKEAAAETGLPLTTFPEQCPFTLEHITEDYWPD